MPERTVWQVRQLFAKTQEDIDDLGDWEPFGVDPINGAIMCKRQTIIEGEKSSVGHELSFGQRYGEPDPED